jgi:DNA polymerase-3 subunit delta'
VHPDVVSFAVLDEEGKVKGQTDRMRELIGAIGYPPHEGRARVVIVDPADELIPQAANAFLKTLEEPPPANHFVLLAAAAARLPITIRSRCQRVPFSPLPATLVARLLVEAHEVDPAAAESAAALAGGSLSRALQLASSEELPARRERVGRLLKAARSGRATSALEAAAEVSGEREEALATLELLWVALHDGLARGAGVAAALPAHPDSERLGAAVPTAALLRAIEAVQEASDAVRGYVSPQLAVERMLLRMQQSGAG